MDAFIDYCNELIDVAGKLLYVHRVDILQKRIDETPQYYRESVRESGDRIAKAEPFTVCLLYEHNELKIRLCTIRKHNMPKQILQPNRIIDCDICKYYNR